MYVAPEVVRCWDAVGEKEITDTIVSALYATSTTDSLIPTILEITLGENTRGNFSKQVINKFDGFTCLPPRV